MIVASHQVWGIDLEGDTKSEYFQLPEVIIPMKLSVVTTIYKSAEVLPEFVERAKNAAKELDCELELILVNDQSPDNGFELAKGMAEKDKQLVVIDLARNVGQHRALWLGLQQATGDLVAIMDGDMEEDPMWLIRFRQAMESSGADVAFGLQSAIKGPWLYRFCRRIFYRLLETFTSQDFPSNVVTARLMTRSYVDALLEYSEREIFLVGIMHMVGFDQVGVNVEKIAKSKSTYSFTDLFRVFVTHTTSFSITPLILVFVAGIAVSVLSMLAVIVLMSMYFWGNIEVPGWISTMIAVMFFFGISTSFNGIIAIYIGTIFLEVKRRPIATIKEVVNSPE